MPGDKHFAIYCRLSKAIGGQVESVDRQERWGRAYHREHPGISHLPVVVYKDNDVSAFSDDAVRPDYDRLRAAVRAGTVAGIWTVEQTRIEANRRRWVELVADLDDAGIGELHTNRDGLVRLDEVADIKHILAWHERKRLRERVSDTLADLAAEGRPAGSTSFGYRHIQRDGRSWLVVVETEAEAARWAAGAVLTGWTLSAVADELNRCEVPLRRGGAKGWTASRVRQMLAAPTIAGKRVYRGEVIGDGDWDPILDEPTWRRLTALFESRNHSRPGRRYLLTGGLAVCGECDAWPLKAMTTLSGRKPYTRRNIYTCHKSSGGCGRVVAAAESLEAHVVGLLLGHLGTAEFRARVTAADTGAAERKRLTAALAAVDGRRRKLAARWAGGGLDDDEWDAARDVIAAERAALNSELAAVPPPVDGVDPQSVVDGWEGCTFDERRFFLRLYLARVVVGRSGRRGRTFDVSRVVVFDRDGVELAPRPALPVDGPGEVDDI